MGKQKMTSVSALIDNECPSAVYVYCEGCSRRLLCFTAPAVRPSHDGSNCMTQRVKNPFRQLCWRNIDTMIVYDAMGRQIEVLVDVRQQAGQHERVFDASSLPSGLYFCQLETKHHRQVKGMLLTK